MGSDPEEIGKSAIVSRADERVCEMRRHALLTASAMSRLMAAATSRTTKTTGTEKSRTISAQRRTDVTRRIIIASTFFVVIFDTKATWAGAISYYSNTMRFSSLLLKQAMKSAQYCNTIWFFQSVEGKKRSSISRK